MVASTRFGDCVLLVILALCFSFSEAQQFVWRASDGTSDCPQTCGALAALQGPAQIVAGTNVAPSACAVNGTEGTQVGSLLFSQNVLSCWTYTNGSAGATSVAHRQWSCLCLNRAAVINNATGDPTASCATTCSGITNGNNASVASCQQPQPQSICYDSTQLTFGYQRAANGSSDLPCLIVQPPATTTQDTLPATRSSNFQCLCAAPADVGSLQISANCSSDAYPAAATAATPPPGPSIAALSATSGSSLSGGAIAGIAIGAGLGGLLVIALIAFVVMRRRRAVGRSGRTRSGGGSELWTDSEKQNAFMATESQFNTLSTDLQAFEDVYAKAKGSEGSETTMTPSKDGGGLGSMPSTGQTYRGNTSKSLANIIELQEEQEIGGVELPFPMPKPDGGVDQQIASLRMPMPASTSTPAESETNRTASQTDALEEVGLTSTWQIEPQDLHCRMQDGKPMLLGEGGYGKVYRGVLNKTDVAVKVITSHDPEQQAKFVQEIITLRACYNTHIVQFLGACIREQQTFMVMEFMPAGDLFSKINNDRESKFGWYKLGSRIAMDVCKGLSYLHSKRIAHLDLKSPNVLLTASYVAKIGDVGLGKIIAHRQAAATRQGSLYWAAPEQLLGTACSTASDIFSFGTVLWEICTGERPINRQTRPLEVPEEAPQEVQDLIEQCHSSEPADRPTADEVYDVLRAAARKSGQQVL